MQNIHTDSDSKSIQIQEDNISYYSSILIGPDLIGQAFHLDWPQSFYSFLTEVSI